MIDDSNTGGNRGDGTQNNPYYWYDILDSNNPNGCHTKEFNQNAEVGYVRVKLLGSTYYTIGQCNLPNGDSWDGYIYFYDENFEQLWTNDDYERWIDGVKTKRK